MLYRSNGNSTFWNTELTWLENENCASKNGFYFYIYCRRERQKINIMD